MTLPLTLPAYERAALELLPPDVAAYLFGGAGSEATLRDNLAAFDRVRLLPRAFATPRAMDITLFGDTYAAPILVAPVGYQQLFHAEGERGTARAAAAMELGYIVPTLASIAMESLANATEHAPHWFQLYLQPDFADSLALVRRAEAAGARAIVVTADAPVDGVRDRQIETGFRLPDQVRAVHFDRLTRRCPASAPRAETTGWIALQKLRDQTRLPLIVKGILHVDDALQVVETGCDGLIVSNHGGRVLDGTIAALDALPAISAAVGARIPVLFDSGIRRGVDVAKALQLGAGAVLVGRPVMAGLAVAGERGAAHVLRMLCDEYRIAAALAD